ncbi:MAG: hypothetical protein FWD46_00600 [Cystobacterineae bacterium]|nr:hypothetical protein [Cystobacterineae bacterium]
MRLLFSSLFTPMDGLPKLVAARRYWAPLIFSTLACCFAQLCLAWRLDLAPQTIARMDVALATAQATESELQAAIEQAQRVVWVLAVFKGLFWPALSALGIAFVLKILAWLLDKPTALKACFCAAVGGLLPLAIRDIARGIIALNRFVIYPEQADKLIATSLSGWAGDVSAWLPLLSALDGYALWAAISLGLGFAAATQMKPWKGILWSLGLYAHYAAFALVMVPAALPAA